MGESIMTHTVFPPEQRAVVLIDLANDFLYPGGVIADAGGPDYQRRAQAILPAVRRLSDGARAAGVLVVYATDAHTPGDAELRKWPPHAMKGTPQAEIAAAVAPRPGDLVLEKRTYSPFLSSGIDAELTARGIRLLYVAGLHTDCCARHTSGDAFQKGYDLVWVTDALQAFTEEAHRQGLEYFTAWYATDPARQFQTADEVVRELSGVRQEAMASR
jgi:nicotinamidase-related amidase